MADNILTQNALISVIVKIDRPKSRLAFPIVLRLS